MKLPQDILFYNILPRLPGKSLLRFMLVSKQWHSFLKTPLFDKLHLHHATNEHHQNNLKLLVFPTGTPNMFNTIDCEAPNEDGLTASQPFPFKANSYDMNILASFGGLVCVGIIKSPDYYVKYSDMLLWNPLTGDYKTLSKPDNWNEQYHHKAFGLYYNSGDDDFKLLCVTNDLNAYIYSLKSDAWRMVNSTENLKRILAYPHQNNCLWPNIALNDKLYFLKYVHDSTRGSIIRFDTKTEKFTEILIPSFETQYNVFLSFTVLRGRIHFFAIYGTELDRKYDQKWRVTVECWWMDENGKWIKVVTLPKASYIITEPLHLISNGTQLVGFSNDRRVWKLDLTKHIMTMISYTPGRSMYIPHRGKYIETLVSPNRRWM